MLANKGGQHRIDAVNRSASCSHPGMRAGRSKAAGPFPSPKATLEIDKCKQRPGNDAGFFAVAIMLLSKALIEKPTTKPQRAQRGTKGNAEVRVASWQEII